MSKINKPCFIRVDNSSDDRGDISFSNSFNFLENKIKRFYKISNHNINFIRAWHGHKKERKFILLISGSLKICTVKIDNWKKPNKNANIHKFVISEKINKVIKIPAGYANGFMNLTDKSKLIFLSTSSLKDSLKDDYRYPYDYWNPWDLIQR